MSNEVYEEPQVSLPSAQLMKSIGGLIHVKNDSGLEGVQLIIPEKKEEK